MKTPCENKGEINRVEDCLALVDSIALRFLNIPGYSPADLKQEARVFLYDAWDAFEGTGQKKSEFPAWAKWRIRNRFIDLWRKEMRRAGKIESLNISDGDGIRVFHEALVKITGEERAVLTAVMEDKSYAEIGRQHRGITKEAVRKRFWKAAARLREVLGEKGFIGVTQSGVLVSKKRASRASG